MIPPIVGRGNAPGKSPNGATLIKPGATPQEKAL